MLILLLFIVIFIVALAMLINPNFFANLKYPPLSKKIKKSETFRIFIRLWGGLWVLVGLMFVIYYFLNR